MTAADESPAQPDDPFHCICDGSPTAVKGCPAHRVRYAAQQFARGQAVDQTLIGLASVLGVENVAPVPDGNAGGAGVYEVAARLTLAGMGEDNPGETVLTAWSGDRTFRAGVDAGRALLLAEVEELGRALDATAVTPAWRDWRRRVVDLRGQLARVRAELAEAGESMYDYQHAATRADEERDQARADRDVAEREMERYRQEALDLVADLAEAIRDRDEARRQADVLKQQLDDRDAEGERDEARAKTDGGEWMTRYYGDAGQADRNVSWSTVSRPAHTHQRHVWVGPVEPVADDGRAT